MLSVHNGVSAAIRALVLAAAATSAVASGAAGCAEPDESTAASASPSAHVVPISAAERPACAQLLGRLQQATLVITAGSELIANSVDKQQLGQRIAAQATQLRRAADLMAQGPTPAPLMHAEQDLVAAL